MALINCPECQKSISDKAEFCPHCGLPAEYFLAAGATAAEPVKDNTPQSSSKNAPPKTSKKATRTKRAPSQRPVKVDFREEILIADADELGWETVIVDGMIFEKKTFITETSTITLYNPLFKKPKNHQYQKR